ncbi:uncharacterized protein MELLADRAFT_59779 [Melampsora larici-populina 98AG31]|uniref:Uncharacterized protein n=1 Tax=Melampsora larici-populina (strain 98AG31 / pathotype 3-4-7) TaxID=747676 RepID=F4R7A0_MELLP|nr:uncharacterized protein MELLADRAFT_59779 [Melampsora larici-populina 98AG31]EGG11555.1 hypothetical protein MELLADRAFT_59779 [Melampsora larici-populina 98AG31]
MYDMKYDQPTHRRRKVLGTVRDTNIEPHHTSSQLCKLVKKEDLHKINDSSSLTNLSDHEDDFAGGLGGLQSVPHKAEVTATQDPTVCWDADETLLDSLDKEILALAAGTEPEKNLIDFGDEDVSDNKPSITAGFMDSHPVPPSGVYNIDCCSEIRYMKAWIDKLEDLVYASLCLPPPEVAAMLEDYKRL